MHRPAMRYVQKLVHVSATWIETLADRHCAGVMVSAGVPAGISAVAGVFAANTIKAKRRNGFAMVFMTTQIGRAHV